MKFYLNNSYQQMHANFSSITNHICPEKLYLDITEDCNLYCKMCRDALSINEKTMDIRMFKRIIDETAPYVKSYSLFNWGEPLLVKDFKERVTYVNNKKRQDANLDISTNGMLLSKEMISFLKQEKVIVTISFDGADAKTFESIRRGSKFIRICRNIENLLGAYGNCPLEYSPGIYTSIQKDNAKQLLEIAKLVHTLGVRRMGMGLVSAPIEYKPELNDELRSELESTYEYLDTNDMLLDLYPTKIGGYLLEGNKYVQKEQFFIKTNCNAPLINASIGYNGDVYLCCNVGECIGNVSNSSFLNLWTSVLYQQARERVNDEVEMSERCRYCAWFNRV